MDSENRYGSEEFAFIGRTLEEYSQFFALTEKELAGTRVLDCPAGTASFTAEARRLGVDTTAADIRYDQTPATLARQATTDIDRALSAFDQSAELFTWEFYSDVHALRSQRETAATRFLCDYASHGDQYVHTTLPDLPFPDDSFDFVLSGHFLFLYDDRLSTDMHLETIEEFLRVGHELRVFPLHGFDSDRSSKLSTVVERLSSLGHEPEIRTVPFEFQRGANEMLVVHSL